MTEPIHTYTPDSAGVCQHCGVVEASHAADGRCLTFDELRDRLRVYVATGQWPERRAPLGAAEDTP